MREKVQGFWEKNDGDERKGRRGITRNLHSLRNQITATYGEAEGHSIKHGRRSTKHGHGL